MRRALALLFLAVDALCRVFLIVLTASVLWVVFGRYVLGSTPRWGEEVALTCLVWLSLLSISLGLAGGYHLRLDLVVMSLPARLRAVAEATNDLIVAGLAAVFVWKGVVLALNNVRQVMPGLGISIAWQYAALPIAGVLMLLGLLAHRLEQDPAEAPR